MLQREKKSGPEHPLQVSAINFEGGWGKVDVSNAERHMDEKNK